MLRHLRLVLCVVFVAVLLTGWVALQIWWVLESWGGVRPGGPWWQVLTGMWLHTGWGHLVFNCGCLVGGLLVAKRPAVAAGLVVAGGVAGDVGMRLWGSGLVAVGISGGVCALAVWVCWDVRAGLDRWWVRFGAVVVLVLLVGNVLAFPGHAAGALAGLVGVVAAGLWDRRHAQAEVGVEDGLGAGGAVGDQQRSGACGARPVLWGDAAAVEVDAAVDGADQVGPGGAGLEPGGVGAVEHEGHAVAVGG